MCDWRLLISRMSLIFLVWIGFSISRGSDLILEARRFTFGPTDRILLISSPNERWVAEIINDHRQDAMLRRLRTPTGFCRIIDCGNHHIRVEAYTPVTFSSIVTAERPKGWRDYHWFRCLIMVNIHLLLRRNFYLPEAFNYFCQDSDWTCYL